MKNAFSSSAQRLGGVVAVALLLAGCGGGGGGEPAATPSIPLAAAFANFVNAQPSYQIAFSGTATTPTGQELPFTGSGFVTETTTASTFEGIPALRKTMTESGQFVLLGNTYPVAATSSSYFDTNYAPIGSVSADGYCVVTDHHPLPATAQPGHNSIWFSSTCYSDATRLVRVGSASTSWVLEPESDSTARFKTIVNTTDNLGATGVSTLTVRVSNLGQVTRLEESGTLSQDGVTLNYTGSYR